MGYCVVWRLTKKSQSLSSRTVRLPPCLLDGIRRFPSSSVKVQTGDESSRLRSLVPFSHMPFHPQRRHLFHVCRCVRESGCVCAREVGVSVCCVCRYKYLRRTHAMIFPVLRDNFCERIRLYTRSETGSIPFVAVMLLVELEGRCKRSRTAKA